MGEGLDLLKERRHLLKKPGGVNLRSSRLLPYADEIAKMVAEGMTQLSILDALRAKGIGTGKSSLNRFIQRLVKGQHDD